jgi:hypothetical protein
MAKSNLIIKEIKSSTGTDESSTLKLIADTQSGKTFIEVTKTIRECYPLTEYDKADQLYEDLNRGGGRKVVKLKDLTK